MGELIDSEMGSKWLQLNVKIIGLSERNGDTCKRVGNLVKEFMIIRMDDPCDSWRNDGSLNTGRMMGGQHYKLKDVKGFKNWTLFARDSGLE